MKIVILERNSVGSDVSVDCISDFGEVTVYGNTVTREEVKERIKEADIIIANKESGWQTCGITVRRWLPSTLLRWHWR